MNRPILGITMGDPAGCGPEITVRALSDATVYQRCRPLVIGDIKCIRDALVFGAQFVEGLPPHPFRFPAVCIQYPRLPA